ncbi:MAG: RNA polymerase sigma-70 factor [Bacteroidota bacterium]
MTNSSIAAPLHTDEVLLQQVHTRNDKRAFEQLYQRYYTLLCRQVHRLVYDESIAEEIVSNVFIKIWRNRAKLRVDKKVKAYLKTAVRNQAIDHLRKQVKSRPFNGEITQDYRSSYAQPDELMIGQEMRAKVEAAIQSLPTQGQHIFRLSREEGMKYREIASSLNISIKTVETHMRRSLIHLRQKILA